MSHILYNEPYFVDHTVSRFSYQAVISKEMWPFYCWCYESKQDCSNSIANALELLLCISSGVTANLRKAFHIVSSPSCLVFVGGDERRVVPEQLQHPSKLTQYQDFIYWTDFQTRSIHQANKTNGLNHTVIHQGYNMVTDLLIYHASRQAGQLTHCGLVAPYGDMDLGQHWLR